MHGCCLKTGLGQEKDNEVSVRHKVNVNHLLNFANFQLVNAFAHCDRRIIDQYVNLAEFAHNLLPCCFHIS